MIKLAVHELDRRAGTIRDKASRLAGNARELLALIRIRRKRWSMTCAYLRMVDSDAMPDQGSCQGTYWGHRLT